MDDDDNNDAPFLLASFEQLARRIPGGIATEDADRAIANLEDATAEVLNAAAGQTWTLDDEVEPPAIVVKTTLAIAKHLFNNPFGYRSEQIGEYAYQLPDELQRDLDKIRELGGDLRSVPTDSTLTVSGTTGLALDRWRVDEALWLR